MAQYTHTTFWSRWFSIVSMAIARFASLAIAQDQFPLAASDRNHRIDDFKASLKRHRNRRAVHDRRRRPLDRQPFAAGHRAIAVQSVAKRVDDTPQ